MHARAQMEQRPGVWLIITHTIGLGVLLGRGTFRRRQNLRKQKCVSLQPVRRYAGIQLGTERDLL